MYMFLYGSVQVTWIQYRVYRVYSTTVYMLLFEYIGYFMTATRLLNDNVSGTLWQFTLLQYILKTA